MSRFRCETCLKPGARAYGDQGHYCRAHRPRPSLGDLLDAADLALAEERVGDLRRLLAMVRREVEGARLPR